MCLMKVSLNDENNPCTYTNSFTLNHSHRNTVCKHGAISIHGWPNQPLQHIANLSISGSGGTGAGASQERVVQVVLSDMPGQHLGIYPLSEARFKYFHIWSPENTTAMQKTKQNFSVYSLTHCCVDRALAGYCMPQDFFLFSWTGRVGEQLPFDEQSRLTAKGSTEDVIITAQEQALRAKRSQDLPYQARSEGAGCAKRP